MREDSRDIEGLGPREFGGLNVGVRERMGSRVLSKVLAWTVGEMTVSFTEKGCLVPQVGYPRSKTLSQGCM